MIRMSMLVNNTSGARISPSKTIQRIWLTQMITKHEGTKTVTSKEIDKDTTTPVLNVNVGVLNEDLNIGGYC